MLNAGKRTDYRPINREDEWGDQFGRWCKIKDLEDTHIANIISYLPTSCHAGTFYFADHLKCFQDEAALRKLHPEFLARAQIPFRHPDEGHWCVGGERGIAERVSGDD